MDYIMLWLMLFLLFLRSFFFWHILVWWWENGFCTTGIHIPTDISVGLSETVFRGQAGTSGAANACRGTFTVLLFQQSCE